MNHAGCVSSPNLNRDLRIVFFVRVESRIEWAVRFVFESNLRIESAVCTTQAVTQPNGLQAYRTALQAYNMLTTSIVNVCVVFNPSVFCINVTNENDVRTTELRTEYLFILIQS